MVSDLTMSHLLCTCVRTEVLSNTPSSSLRSGASPPRASFSFFFSFLKKKFLLLCVRQRYGGYHWSHCFCICSRLKLLTAHIARIFLLGKQRGHFSDRDTFKGFQRWGLRVRADFSICVHGPSEPRLLRGFPVCASGNRGSSPSARPNSLIWFDLHVPLRV